MPTHRETATTFVLGYLAQHAERELRLADLVTASDGRFTGNNITQSLMRLLAVGKIVRSKEGKEAWWAISQVGLDGEERSTGGKKTGVQPDTVQGEVQSDAPKVLVKRPTMTITGGRW